MTDPWWRPASEAEATTNAAALIEFLRATGRPAPFRPADVVSWLAADRARAHTAVCAFMALDPGAGVRAALLRPVGPRPACIWIVWPADSPAPNRRTWTRDDLRAGTRPAPLEAVLARLEWPALLDALTDHLLVAETRPDDRVLWRGDPADPWPWVALAIGATVVLFEGDPHRVADDLS